VARPASPTLPHKAWRVCPVTISRGTRGVCEDAADRHASGRAQSVPARRGAPAAAADPASPPGSAPKSRGPVHGIGLHGMPDTYADEDGYVDMEAEDLRRIAVRAGGDRHWRICTTPPSATVTVRCICLWSLLSRRPGPSPPPSSDSCLRASMPKSGATSPRGSPACPASRVSGCRSRFDHSLSVRPLRGPAQTLR
jgi:hypothetical protein